MKTLLVIAAALSCYGDPISVNEYTATPCGKTGQPECIDHRTPRVKSAPVLTQNLFQTFYKTDQPLTFAVRDFNDEGDAIGTVKGGGGIFNGSFIFTEGRLISILDSDTVTLNSVNQNGLVAGFGYTGPAGFIFPIKGSGTLPFAFNGGGAPFPPIQGLPGGYPVYYNFLDIDDDNIVLALDMMTNQKYNLSPTTVVATPEPKKAALLLTVLLGLMVIVRLQRKRA